MTEDISQEKKKVGPKFSRMHANSNGHVDYEDFPEVVPFLQSSTNEKSGVYGTPKKRYRKYILILLYQQDIKCKYFIVSRIICKSSFLFSWNRL